MAFALGLLATLAANEITHAQAAGVPEAAGGSAAWTPSPAASPPAAEVSAACDTMAALVSALPGTAISRSTDPFEDEFLRRSVMGCSVKVRGTFAALKGGAGPDEKLRALAEGGTWRYVRRHQADGPDGTLFAIRTDTVRCVIEGRWDGGDDSDPTYVPEDWYEFFIGCTAVPPPKKAARRAQPTPAVTPAPVMGVLPRPEK